MDTKQKLGSQLVRPKLVGGFTDSVIQLWSAVVALYFTHSEWERDSV